MARLFTALLCCACARPPAAEAPRAHGVEVERVRLTTWRGGELAANGTAASATLVPDGFRADGVTLRLPNSTTLTAAHVEGQLDGSHLLATRGVEARTPDGCAGSAKDPVRYDDGVVVTAGPVHASGCGFQLDGQRLTYRVAERLAEVDGPVRTRVEAGQP